jgi:hypothetical protein
MKDNTEIKKTSERPPEPKLKLEDQSLPAQIALVAFDDGQMFKYLPHPSGKSFAIMGRVGNKQIQLAGTPHQAIAEIICTSVNAISAAVKEEQAQQTSNENQTDNGSSNQG